MLIRLSDIKWALSTIVLTDSNGQYPHCLSEFERSRIIKYLKKRIKRCKFYSNNKEIKWKHIQKLKKK